MGHGTTRARAWRNSQRGDSGERKREGEEEAERTCDRVFKLI